MKTNLLLCFKGWSTEVRSQVFNTLWRLCSTVLLYLLLRIMNCLVQLHHDVSADCSRESPQPRCPLMWGCSLFRFASLHSSRPLDLSILSSCFWDRFPKSSLLLTFSIFSTSCKINYLHKRKLSNIHKKNSQNKDLTMSSLEPTSTFSEHSSSMGDSRRFFPALFWITCKLL